MGTCDPGRGRKIERRSIGAPAPTPEALGHQPDEGGPKKKVDGPVEVRVAPATHLVWPFKNHDGPDERSE